MGSRTRAAMKSAYQNKLGDAPAKKGGATEQAYLQIKNMIYYNEVVPGQKLIYQDLAKRLNISVTPVIQALNRLVEHSNLVRHESNRGYFVGEITETEARELYEAREALEIYMIPLIIKNINPKALNSIREAFREPISPALPQYRRLILLKDTQFHLRMAEYAHNSVLLRMLTGIFEQIYLKYPPEYLTDTRVKSHAKEHRAVLDAIRRGDIDKATSFIKEHIRTGLDYVVATLHADKVMIG